MFVIKCVEIQGENGNMMYQSGEAVFTGRLELAAQYSTEPEAQTAADGLDQGLTYLIVEVV